MANHVRNALGLITQHFPGARVALDTAGRFMIMKFMTARMHWACDNPRDLERWHTGWRLHTSLTFAQAPRALRRHLPPTYRYLLPAWRILAPPLITAYKLNLYTIVHSERSR